MPRLDIEPGDSHMIRRIGYISQARIKPSTVVPEGLSHIIIHGRRFNQLNGITGLLSYDKGVYIQFIEGEESVLGALHERINRDPRHSDVVTFVDERVRERAFSSWALKLSDSSQLDARFKQLVDEAWPRISQMPRAVVDQIRVFHDPKEASNAPASVRMFDQSQLESHEYRLTAFPSVSGRRMVTPELLDLFARMKSGWLGFQALAERCRHAGVSPSAVLADLDAKGVIRSRPASAATGGVAAAGGHAAHPAPDSFYDKLRNFFKKKPQ
jgi:hypothetical protein